jgi:hypothetical protein
MSTLHIATKRPTLHQIARLNMHRTKRVPIYIYHFYFFYFYRYKCNVDVSFSHQRNRVGLEKRTKMSFASFVLAKTVWFSPVCSEGEPEGNIFLWALWWVMIYNEKKNVNFELDSKRVVDSFRLNKDDALEISVQ